MNNQIITFAAEPPVTRWTYLKTVLILLAAAEVMNVFAQIRLVQKEEFKFSSIIVAVLSLIISCFLTRLPLTKSLTIDYAKRLVIVGFATLKKLIRRSKFRSRGSAWIRTRLRTQFLPPPNRERA